MSRDITVSDVPRHHKPLSDCKRTEIADMGSGLSSGQGEAAAATVVAAAASLTR